MGKFWQHRIKSSGRRYAGSEEMEGIKRGEGSQELKNYREIDVWYSVSGWAGIKTGDRKTWL